MWGPARRSRRRTTATTTCSSTPTGTRRRASTPRSWSRPSATDHDELVTAGCRAHGHLEAPVREPRGVRRAAVVEPHLLHPRAARERVAEEEPPERGSHRGGGPVDPAAPRRGHVDRAAADPDVLAGDVRLALRHLRHQLEPAAAHVGPHAELLVHDRP